MLSALLQRYILKAIHNRVEIIFKIVKAVSATAKIHFESNSQLVLLYFENGLSCQRYCKDTF
jgi:hypothetical protein